MWLYHFPFLPAMRKNSCCSTPSPAFGVVSVSDFHHSNRCAHFLRGKICATVNTLCIRTPTTSHGTHFNLICYGGLLPLAYVKCILEPTSIKQKTDLCLCSLTKIYQQHNLDGQPVEIFGTQLFSFFVLLFVLYVSKMWTLGIKTLLGPCFLHTHNFVLRQDKIIYLI